MPVLALVCRDDRLPERHDSRVLDPVIAERLAEVVAESAERRPNWMRRAACKGVGAGVFIVTQGGDVRPAKALCASCEVLEECDRFSVSFDRVLPGIYAGKSAKQRSPARAREVASPVVTA